MTGPATRPLLTASQLIFLFFKRSTLRSKILMSLLTLDLTVTPIMTGPCDCALRLRLNLQPSHLHWHHITAYLFIEHRHGKDLSGIMDGGNAFHLEVEGGAQSIQQTSANGCKVYRVSKQWDRSLRIWIMEENEWRVSCKVTCKCYVLLILWHMSEACYMCKGQE